MHEIEDRLRDALRRKPAPPGFAARVLSRLESAADARPAARLSRPRLWAVAAALVIAAGVGLIERERWVERRNRAALEESLEALSVAATQLDRAREKAFSHARWDGVAERLSRLSVPGAEPIPPATHSKARGSRI